MYTEYYDLHSDMQVEAPSFSQVLPNASTHPPGCRRGYLWRLSDRPRMLSGLSQAPTWKCKYWILSGGSLYFYSSGRDTAAGVIDLTQV